jgi:hypothetical protein
VAGSSEEEPGNAGLLPANLPVALGKFYARGIENSRVLLLDNVFRYLWKERVSPKDVALSRKSVACNRSVAFLSCHMEHFNAGSAFLAEIDVSCLLDSQPCGY